MPRKVVLPQFMKTSGNKRVPRRYTKLHETAVPFNDVDEDSSSSSDYVKQAKRRRQPPLKQTRSDKSAKTGDEASAESDTGMNVSCKVTINKKTTCVEISAHRPCRRQGQSPPASPSPPGYASSKDDSHVEQDIDCNQGNSNESDINDLEPPSTNAHYSSCNDSHVEQDDINRNPDHGDDSPVQQDTFQNDSITIHWTAVTSSQALVLKVSHLRHLKVAWILALPLR